MESLFFGTDVEVQNSPPPPAQLLIAGPDASAESGPPAYQKEHDRDMRCPEVYACDLPPDLQEEEVHQLFETYGEVLSVPVFRAGQQSLAVVVAYRSSEAAVEAQATLDHALVRGRTIRCLLVRGLHRVQATMISGERLVLEDVDPNIEGHRLHDVCSLFGMVLDSAVDLDATGCSRGLGFVHYASLEEAARATAALNGVTVGSKPLKVKQFTWEDVGRFERLDLTYLMDLPQPPMDGSMDGWMQGPAYMSPGYVSAPPMAPMHGMPQGLPHAGAVPPAPLGPPPLRGPPRGMAAAPGALSQDHSQPCW